MGVCKYKYSMDGGEPLARISKTIIYEECDGAEYIRPHFFPDTSKGDYMHQQEIQFNNRYALSVEEASTYFRIGEGKLRKIISENKDADYILWNGNRAQIKRTLFEKFLDKCNII